MEVFPNNIFIDMQVGPYFPDICLIISGMISIDIEIDEPYVMGSKKRHTIEVVEMNKGMNISLIMDGM